MVNPELTTIMYKPNNRYVPKQNICVNETSIHRILVYFEHQSCSQGGMVETSFIVITSAGKLFTTFRTSV